MLINEELKKLIPPLTSEEYQQLEANILLDGCRDALVTWNETLIDGHNRYEICTKHNIDYKTRPIYLKTIEEVKLWMIDNQKGRRNLSDGWRFQLSQSKRAILAEMGKAKKVESGKETGRGNIKVLPTVDKTFSEEKPHNTQKEIAKDLGWSTGKVAMADKVWKQAEPEVKQAILEDKISINAASKLINLPEEEKNEIVSDYLNNPNIGTPEILKKINLAQLNTGDEEWYTPEKYIESARIVMGHIDIDPASNDHAQKKVKAKIYYTKDDDGLSKDWRGNVWLNPPYTARVINKFLEKIAVHYASGEINQAIVLTNSNTDTSWFHALANVSSCVCFTAGRINFYKESGEKSSPTNGQMFFYVGHDKEKFKEEFSKHGLVMVKA